MKPSGTYGLIAEFEDPTALVAATHRAYQAGYRRMDAYSPFPIEELADALGVRKTRLPLLVLLGWYLILLHADDTAAASTAAAVAATSG